MNLQYCIKFTNENLVCYSYLELLMVRLISGLWRIILSRRILLIIDFCWPKSQKVVIYSNCNTRELNSLRFDNI